MEFAGYLAEDAPDPRERHRVRYRELGVAAAGLVPQPHVEERGELSFSVSRSGPTGGPQVVTEVGISRTYVLWRNPSDRDDPANLAELDAGMREALQAPIDRPLPPWFDEARAMLRFPRLWEAVQTYWRPEDAPSPAERLIAHAEYVLSNRFREQLGLQEGPELWASPIPPAALQPHDVVVDGAARPGLLLDTDPFVLGLATGLEDGRVVTVVVPRDELPLLTLELVSDAPV